MDINGVIKPAIFAWLKSVSLTVSLPVGSPPVTIYWDNPEAPRPKSPSVRVKLMSGPNRVGMDATEAVASAFEGESFEVSGNRTFMLSVNAYGDAALQYVSDLITSVYDPANTDPLDQVGISILYTSDVRELSEQLETKFEERYQLDVKLMTVESKVITAASVASVEMISPLSLLPLDVAAPVPPLDVIDAGLIDDDFDVIDGGGPASTETVTIDGGGPDQP